MAAAGSLYSRPHDYDVLNRETISFVALDREYGGASGAGPAQRIAGYVSCSLKTIHAVAGAQRFKSDELNRFVASLAARARDRAERDCGYDVFSIDGLPVGAVAEGERPYRAGTGLAKLLVFYAMEFVRLAARQLGVALVISGAEAVQTKAILTGGFGFTHYNRENALRWLRMAFEDYYTAKLEPERGEGGGAAARSGTRGTAQWRSCSRRPISWPSWRSTARSIWWTRPIRRRATATRCAASHRAWRTWPRSTGSWPRRRTAPI